MHTVQDTTWTDADIASSDSNRELYLLCKRLLDLAFVLFMLPLLAPVFVSIALAIKFDSPGPVLFVQKRVGARRFQSGNRTLWKPVYFPCYKFRSMNDGADQSVHQAYIREFVSGDAEAKDHTCAQFKLTDDPRITRIGHFLRKTSVDELPQLLNVLRGDMSLVGPRPVPDYEVDGYREDDFERLATVPGMTGLWQVTGRGNVTFDEMVALDIDYVRNQSLWLDLKIILLTVPAALSGRGAE